MPKPKIGVGALGGGCFTVGDSGGVCVADGAAVRPLQEVDRMEADAVVRHALARDCNDGLPPPYRVGCSSEGSVAEESWTAAETSVVAVRSPYWNVQEQFTSPTHRRGENRAYLSR